MTKKDERLEARRLRREGMSIKAIAEALGCGKGTVSDWCHDIVLTQEQEEALQKSDKRRKAQIAAAEKNVRVHREKRLEYQEEGRIKARENEPLHVAGCMLYWGEGAKSRGSLVLVNSDASMMSVFIRFLRESMQIPEEKFTIRINAYLGNGVSENDIKQFWLDALGLDWSSLRGCRFDIQPISSQQKGRKLIYGTCALQVSSVRYLQHIYGAIQEYTGIDRPEWLD
jgi:predicted transcriptional regulator